MADPYIGEIALFAFQFAPTGWAFCQGQTMGLAQNQALYSLLGTKYGGDGKTNFLLPHLGGRVPVHVGISQSQTQYSIGVAGGLESVALTAAQNPPHAHVFGAQTAAAANDRPVGDILAQTQKFNFFATPSNPVTLAADSVAPGGGGGAHENRQPFAAMNYCIAITGVYPMRS